LHLSFKYKEARQIAGNVSLLPGSKHTLILSDSWFLKLETCVFEDALYSIRTAFQAGLKTCGIYDETSNSDIAQIKNFSTVYCKNYEEVQKYFFE